MTDQSAMPPWASNRSRADALTLLAERFLAPVPEADESLNRDDRSLITVHVSAGSAAEALTKHAALDHEVPFRFEDGSVTARKSVWRCSSHRD